MKAKLTLAARILFGFIFFASGLAGLLGLAQPPPDLPEKLKLFTAGMEATGYFMTLVKGTETVCGALIMLGMYVPLCLVILAPVVLNIFLVHAFMAPEGLPLALILGGLMIFLAFFSPYSSPIKNLFRK